MAEFGRDTIREGSIFQSLREMFKFRLANFEAVTRIASIHILILSRCIDSGKYDVSIVRRYYFTPVYYFSSLEANVILPPF